MHNSESILRAQEEFSAKQASILAALDKLHNAILVESRFIKAFFFYSCVVFLLYLLTSAKQTLAIRGQLYFGLCVTLVVEVALIRLGAADDDDLTRPFWIVSKVLLLRSAFLAVAAAQILHAIFAFKYGGPSNPDLEAQRHSALISPTPSSTGQSKTTPPVVENLQLVKS